MTWSIAVDLGTANTTAAISRDGVDTLLRLRGESSMPSSVLWTGPEPVTGSAAVRNRVGAPEAFVPSPKRLLTRGAPFAVVGGATVPLVQLLAVVLAAVRREALQQMNGEPPAQVVLTRPVAWSDDQVTTLVEAAVVAGFARAAIRTVSEPEAAVQYYAARAGGQVPPGGAVAVFDFGAGTCDVAVLERSGQGWRLAHHDGDARLGGADLDEKVLGFVRDELVARGEQELLRRLDGPDGLADALTLHDQARSAKEDLSGSSSSTVWIASAGRSSGVTINRGEYQRLIAPEAARAGDLVARAAAAAPRRLSAVYLTGGSSRGPAVQDAVARSGGAPLATLDDPKAVVALGALHVPEPLRCHYPVPPAHLDAGRAPARAARSGWSLPMAAAVLLLLAAALRWASLTVLATGTTDLCFGVAEAAVGAAFAVSGWSWRGRHRPRAGALLLAAAAAFLVAAGCWLVLPSLQYSPVQVVVAVVRVAELTDGLGSAAVATGAVLLLVRPGRHLIEELALAVLGAVGAVWAALLLGGAQPPRPLVLALLLAVPSAAAIALLVGALLVRTRAPRRRGAPAPRFPVAPPPYTASQR